MSSSKSPSRIDRFVDALIDRNHPFWNDERQTAVFHEASTAGFTLQGIVLPIVGSLCLLIGGRPVIGVVTAMLLTSVLSQFLVQALLARRHVEIDMKSWRRDSSRFRRLLTVAVVALYFACFAWARFGR
jgi:hypothetical protein